MIALGDIMLALKELSAKADYYYTGKLDAKQEKSFGVYQKNGDRGRVIAIGGKDATKTQEKAVSILVHWNRNSVQTEKIAYELYEHIPDLTGIVIDGHTIKYVQLLHNEPIDVGTDENNVYERVIDFIVYYE